MDLIRRSLNSIAERNARSFQQGKRRFPSLQRNGEYDLVSAGNEQLQLTNVNRLPGFGFHK